MSQQNAKQTVRLIASDFRAAIHRTKKSRSTVSVGLGNYAVGQDASDE